MRYIEFVTDMSTNILIRCHQNAFRYFGGYPEEILYDNMKQVVVKQLLKQEDLSLIHILLNVPSTHSKTHVAATKVGLFLAGIVQLLCVLLADKLHDAKLARMPRRPIISRTMRSELFTSPTRTSMLKIISVT